MYILSKKTVLVAFLIISILSLVKGQQLSDTLKFEIINQIPSTTIKNQNRSSTCWSFSVLSMLESEILKSRGDTLDLSEMYIVFEKYKEYETNYSFCCHRLFSSYLHKIGFHSRSLVLFFVCVSLSFCCFTSFETRISS